MQDIEDFMESEYGYRPAHMFTLNEFETWKEDNGFENDWDYPLEEYEYIASLGLDCVPVRFSNDQGGYDYRFCEHF